MFDIGWSEMAVIALLTLIVIGPRELPRVMRTVGQWVRKAQSLAREFQRGLDDMAREADLEDAKKLIDTGRSIANPKKMVMDTLDASDTSDTVAEEFKDLQKAMRTGPEDDKASKASKEAGAKADSAPPPKEPAPEEPAPEEPTAADESVKATVVKQPTNVAPPDSITPPPDPTTKAAAKVAAKSTAKPKAKSTAKSAGKSTGKTKPKAKPRAKPKAEAASAGSDGSQKTA